MRRPFAGRSAGPARIVPAGEGRVRVEGPLDFSTVAALLAQSEPLLARGRALAIDLAGVSTANSAGLALLVEWMELARSRGIHLQYYNLPDSLVRIAELSNLGTLLPVASEAA